MMIGLIYDIKMVIFNSKHIGIKGSISMKRAFSIMQTSLEKTQFKYPKTLEISRGDSPEVISFFRWYGENIWLWINY